MSHSDPAARLRIPDLSLAPLVGGEPVRLRRARHAAVLVLLAGAPGPDDTDYLRRLAEAATAVAGWDGRVLVVASGDATAVGGALSGLALPFPVLADPEGAVAAAAGVAAPALVVADQWGEVHWSSPADAPTPWPKVEELEQWARFLSIRCAG